MTVNLENCDRIIAEFEFGKDYWLENLIVEWEYGDGRYNHAKKLYTESLDSLVPVWEKLNKHLFLEVCRHEVKGYHWCFFRDLHNKKIDNIDEQAFKITIQQAAALATAKAIKELDNGN